MVIVRAARRMLCSAAAAAATPARMSRWERLKTSKAGVWCRSLFSDYREACRDVVVGAWEQPLKSSVYITVLSGGLVCFYTKPDASSFEENLIKHSNQLGLLSPWIRSNTSNSHVQSLIKIRNEGRLQYISFGLLSMVYCADYDLNTTLYEAQCSYLSVPWRELPHRVLDVGFASHWWILDLKMKDYDINEEEFKHLPESMQLTSPPSIEEVLRNESMHKESWLPLSVDCKEKETIMVAGEESVQEKTVLENQNPT